MRLGCYVAAACAALLMTAAGEPFKQGDRVAHIGDSITHGGSYHANLYLFHATRFPDQPFKVYNCGISGDTAPGTNKRFEWDIAPREPNVATIMLGMNDAWAWLFNPEEPEASRTAGTKNAYDMYTREMEALVERLLEKDCRVILIKPSIYDQTAQLETKNNLGKNDLLERYAAFLDTLAAQHELEIVDFQTPMLEVNKTLQAADPSATVVGRDRVHPGAAGHFVMSYAFLKDMEMPGMVSSISVDMAARTIRSEKTRITMHKAPFGRDGSVTFTSTEKALPYPVADNQRAALDWVPFQNAFNRQMFWVKNLEPGTYELRIDDQLVGSWSETELAAGINLADYPATPQYQQALEVKALNDERLAVVDKLRAIAHVRHTMISKLESPVDESDTDALRAALKAYVAKSEGQSWHGYLGRQAEKYLEHAPHEAELRAQEEKLLARIWEVNQPRAHQWLLTAKVP